MPKAAKKHPVAATKGWAMRMMMAEARADWTSSPLAEATETETAEEVKESRGRGELVEMKLKTTI